MQTMIHPCPPETPGLADDFCRELLWPGPPLRPANLKVALLAVFFVLAGPGAFAQLDGEDNFNDNSRDPAKWGTADTTFGTGRLSETNQRLHYLTSGAAGDWGDYATRQWQTNYGRFTDNWEAQLDVNLPAVTLDQEDEVEIGLGVGNVADLGDSATITLNTYRTAAVARQFWSDIRTDNSPSLSDVIAATTATSAAVRIRWTAATRTLAFEYDANGAAGGYTWTLLTARIIGEGGYDWGMTDTSQFGVAVFGASYSQDLTLASSVYADNFLARSEIVIPAPRLSIVPASSGSATISWTPAPPGWVLQETPSLSAPAWTNSPSGATNPISVPAALPTKLYRLHKP
jgi:hypothetical protein